MDNWKEEISSEYIDLISGFAFKSKNFHSEQIEGTLPVIKIKNVANGDVNFDSVVYHSYDESLIKYELGKGDVLIAMTGNHPQAKSQVVGDVSKYKLDSKSLLNQRVGKIVAKENADLDFIYYLFKNKETHNYLANQSSGSANQANISKKNILSLDLNFPPLPEQKAIAEVLSSIDDKIDLLHRQNKTLEAMAETLFRQWFVEEADESWEDGTLSDLIEVKYGKDHKKLLEGEVPVYGSGGIMRYAEKALYEKESVLIPRKGSLNNVIYINETFWTVDTMFYSIMKKPNIAKFIFQFVKKIDLAAMNVGSAVPSMTTKVLNSMPLLIPSDDFFENFENAVTPWYDKMAFNTNQIQTLTNLRDTLLPKLMSGEVRIKMN